MVEPEQQIVNETCFGFFSIIEYKLSPIDFGGNCVAGAFGIVKSSTGYASFYLKIGPDDRQWIMVAGAPAI